MREAQAALMQRQLKVDKIYQGFRQGKAQKLSLTMRPPDVMQIRILKQSQQHGGGDPVQQNFEKGVNRLTKQTQERIRSDRQKQEMEQIQKVKEEEQKKFEVLQVLNLLQKTEIHDRDLHKRQQRDPSGSPGQILKTNAIEDAILKVEADRLYNSQLSGQNYQQMVQNRLSDRKQ